MNEFTNIINGMKSTPWLITQEGMDVILEIVERRRQGVRLDHEEIRIRLQGAGRDGGNKPEAGGGVGIVPLYGPIFPKANLMTEMSGATSLESFKGQFVSMLQNDLVQSIIIDVDSPGGSAFMVPETAKFIFENRGKKPIIAVANSMAASAALFIASQADEFYVTDSGLVGSLGTILVHDDYSEKLKKEGIKTTLITATDSPYKGELAEEVALSDGALAYAQGLVDDMNDKFVQAVARGRGTTVEDVKANYGGGRVLTAKDALAVGMVDGIRTLDDVLGDALSNGGKLSTTARATEQRLSTPKPEQRNASDGLGEPGTGTPPQVDPEIHPSTVEDTYEDGERFDKPEVEESLMNREQLLAYASRLGIANADSLDDEALATAVSNKLDTALDQVEELNEAVAQAERTRSFATDYPEEYAEMQEARRERTENKAALYANGFSRLKDDSGNDTKHGLSIAARETVEQAHLSLALGQFDEAQLTELINAIASKNAVVEFGEKGSSRVEDRVLAEDQPSGNRLEDRKMFANKVKEIMEEDSLDRKSAVRLASERFPELAQAYANG